MQIVKKKIFITCQNKQVIDCLLPKTHAYTRLTTNHTVQMSISEEAAPSTAEMFTNHRSVILTSADFMCSSYQRKPLAAMFRCRLTTHSLLLLHLCCIKTTQTPFSLFTLDFCPSPLTLSSHMGQWCHPFLLYTNHSETPLRSRPHFYFIKCC